MSTPHWQSAFLARHKLPGDYLDYAQQWFAPLAKRLASHHNCARRTLLIAVNGSQGSGKTTVCDYLCDILSHEFGLKAVSLSLDDFYLTRAERLHKAETVHPLLATRGVPGTHDMSLLNQTLDSLLSGSHGRVLIPRFDKASDDRKPAEQWTELNDPLDLVLLEGWCLGVTHQDKSELVSPANELEREEDAQAVWRTYVNESTRESMEPLYQRVDRWVMLCAPSFDCVFRWRLEQESKLADSVSAGLNSRVMDRGEIARFIQFYERLTRHCLAELPARVDHLYHLDDQRRILAESHRGEGDT